MVNRFFKNVDEMTAESGLDLAPSFNKDTHARAIRKMKQSLVSESFASLVLINNFPGPVP